METTTLNTKLLTFQGTVEKIKKDGTNSFFKKQNGKASSYATLPHILAEIKPILNDLNLVLTQPIINGSVFSVITDVENGEKVESGIQIPTNLNAQQIGSAITYFRRYTLSSLLSLEIDEDDDGNNASQPAAKKVEQPKPAAAELPYLNANSPQFASIVQHLKDGGSIDDVKKFRISPEVEKELLLEASK